MANKAVGPVGLSLMMYALQFKSATVVVYSGTQPLTPETAIAGGNVALGTFTYATTPFGSYINSGGFNITTGAFVSTTITPSNAGTASFARVSFTLAASHSGVWTTGQAYTKGDIVTSNSSYWLCIVNGTAGATAPTGTSILGFDDGGSAWCWICPTSSGQSLVDMTVGATPGFEVQVNSVAFDPAINQTITVSQIQTSAV